MSGITGRILGVYRHAERGCQKLDFVDLGFSVSGLRRMVLNGHEVTPMAGGFFLAVPGTVMEYDYGPDRQNWVISLSGAEFRSGRDPMRVEFFREDAWISLPMRTLVPPERIPGWVLEFERLWEAQRNPLPKNLWRIELGVQRILGAILESEMALQSFSETPASRLKAWLDADRDFNRNLSGVAEELGYSDYHLRELFSRAYGVSPQVYRNRCRMALAMDWITGTTLSLKEIAMKLGFHHFSHFSTTFHRAFSLSPRSALRRYRFVGQLGPIESEAAR